MKLELLNIILSSSLVATMGGAIIKGIQLYLKRRKIKQHEQGLSDLETLYSLLNELNTDLKADRTFIFKTENGGGIPRPGCETTLTILNEIYTGNFRKSKDKWYKQPIDQQLVNYVSRAIKEKTYSFNTEEIEKGILRDSFAVEGACYHCIVHIKTTPSKAFYLGITWHSSKNKTELRYIDRDLIRVKVSKLNQLIQ